ncbi:exopolysaccharide biosynthesis polyprenyl glycosylphosphotransferase [soil metagenome]
MPLLQENRTRPKTTLRLWVTLRPLARAFGYLAAKRVLDAVLAGFLLIGTLPLMALLALLIKIEDGGPVLYRQLRVGREGRLIPFYKFRSMRVNADAARHELLGESDCVGPAFKMRRDPRVTRVGRVMRRRSLDELPQLISVLIGHMALVGPRPHLCEEVAAYTDRQRERLRVKPGLLCLREVGGRSDLDFDRWIELDLQYSETRGLLADAKILLRAIPAVLKGKGAY